MPNFCTLTVYFQLDNIHQGIASLKKYCISQWPKEIGQKDRQYNDQKK